MKLCPFLGKDCLGIGCGVWDDYAKHCSFMNISFLVNLSKIKKG